METAPVKCSGTYALHICKSFAWFGYLSRDRHCIPYYTAWSPVTTLKLLCDSAAEPLLSDELPADIEIPLHSHARMDLSFEYGTRPWLDDLCAPIIRPLTDTILSLLPFC